MRRMISDKAQKYIKELSNSHPDPTAEWGAGADYMAGTGIDIDEKVISVNNTIATKNDLNDYELKSEAFSGNYNDLDNKPDLSDKVVRVLYGEGSFYEKIFENWPNVIFVDNINNTGSYLPVVENNLPPAPDTTFKFKGVLETRQLDLKVHTVRYLYVRSGGSVDIEDVDLTNDYNDLIGKPTPLPDPDLTTDGDYVLNCNIANGSANLSWDTPMWSYVSGNNDGNYWTDITIDDPSTGYQTYNIPPEVTGTNDGTNWTSLTVGTDTYNIPQGGGSSYTFANGLTESSGTVTNDLFTKAAVTLNGTSQRFILNYNNLAIGQNAGTTGMMEGTAIGASCQAGQQSTALGSESNAPNVKQVAIGFQARCSNTRSGQVVIGNKNAVDNDSSFIFADGDTNSSNPNLMVIKSDGTVISKNLPAAPTTTGTYTLQCTVDAQGNVTYNWI